MSASFKNTEGLKHVAQTYYLSFDAQHDSGFKNDKLTLQYFKENNNVTDTLF